MNIWIILLLFSTMNAIASSSVSYVPTPISPTQMAYAQMSQSDRDKTIQEVKEELESMLVEIDNMEKEVLNKLEQYYGRAFSIEEANDWQQLKQTIDEVTTTIRQLEQPN